METCVYYDECRNKDNFLKCSKCENNPENFERLEKNDFEGFVHDKKNKYHYIYRDNFEDY